MARYGAGVTNRAGVNSADTILFQLRATGTTQRLLVRQVVFAVLTAPTNAPQPYLTFASANGTSSTTLAGQKFDNADAAALGTFDSAWSGNPTITTANKLTVGAMAVTAGGGWIWDFRDVPLVMQASTTVGGLCIVNAAASGATVGAVSASVIWDE